MSGAEGLSLGVLHLKFSPWLALLAAIMIQSCASPQPLTGGVKDTTPPAIVEAESTPNQQIHFKEKQIILTFDEWLNELRDIEKQLVISPLMPKKPEIKQKGKSIIITLPDSLRENTTYSMNFGNVIQDLNENNKLENYSFIFSTGDFLDSISLKGKVLDAVTLKAAPDIWVMLYPIGDDSVVYKQKPDYLSKTNAEGRWAISNIRNDHFQVVALKDDNLNFIYDQESELFGWLDAIVGTDSSATLPDIFVSPRSKRTIIQDVQHVAPGWLKLYIPGSDPINPPLFFPAIGQSKLEWKGDSLTIWYPPSENYAGLAIVGTDSTRIRVSEKPAQLNTKLKLSPLSGRLYPFDDALVKAEVPIAKIDTSRIYLQRDTTLNIPFSIVLDTSSDRIIHLHSNWIPPSRYIIKFAAGAVTDMWGRSNDTFNMSFVVNGLDQYSNLEMNIAGLDSTFPYLVMIKLGENTERTFFVDHQSMAKISTKGLVPGKYTIEVVEDVNGNGRWDSGDYHLKRQPEQKRIFVPENLRAGWDVEISMNWALDPVAPDLKN